MNFLFAVKSTTVIVEQNCIRITKSCLTVVETIALLSLGEFQWGSDKLHWVRSLAVSHERRAKSESINNSPLMYNSSETRDSCKIC